MSDQNLRLFIDDELAHTLDDEWNELPVCSTCHQLEGALMKMCPGTFLTPRESNLVYALFCEKHTGQLTTIAEYNQGVESVRQFEAAQVQKTTDCNHRLNLQIPAIKILPWMTASGERIKHNQPIQLRFDPKKPDELQALSMDEAIDLNKQMGEALRRLENAYENLRYSCGSWDRNKRRVEVDPWTFEDGKFGFHEKPIVVTLNQIECRLAASEADILYQDLNDSLYSLDIEYHPENYGMTATESALLSQQERNQEERELEQMEEAVEHNLYNYCAAYEKLQRLHPEASETEIAAMLKNFPRVDATTKKKLTEKIEEQSKEGQNLRI